MRHYRGGLLTVSILAICLSVFTYPVAATANAKKIAEADTAAFEDTLETIVLPKVKQPGWLVKQLEAEAAARARSANTGTITVAYDVTTRGSIKTSLAEFKTQANETLNSVRGWARMNIEFKEVASGGQFTLVLSEASQLPTFSSGCSADYSCRAGRYVIINQDRWMGATQSWREKCGNTAECIRDYRHMVVNHEVGHWLGHDHAHCGGPGQYAAVMQQQSIDLQGCKFNAWPLASELWSTQLGIQ